MPLTGGSQGGTWSGDGVLGAFFDPALINPPGDFDVTYVVDQGYGMGCVDSSTISIAVFPNPPFVEILNYIPTDGYIASGGGTDIAGYQWSTLSGGPIEGETNQVLENPFDGMYHVVTVTNSYGCGTDSEATIFYAADVADFRPGDWRVWFDAASRKIASNRPIDRVEWFDANGRVLSKDGLLSNQLSIARVWQNGAFRTFRVYVD
jgi:hypothetical protein